MVIETTASLSGKKRGKSLRWLAPWNGVGMTLRSTSAVAFDILQARLVVIGKSYNRSH